MSNFSIKKLNQLINQEYGGKIKRLADHTGIERRTINAWIKGKSKPSAKTLPILLDFTGKSMDYFFPKQKEQNNISKISDTHIEYQNKPQLDESELHAKIIEYLQRAILSDRRIKDLEDKCEDLIIKVEKLEKLIE